jgi:hypothetical protein
MVTSMKPATRTIRSGYEDERIEIDTYQDKHRPQNQPLAGGRFPLNPALREWFNNTPNEERERAELDDWWELPFIETYTWAEFEKHQRDTQASHRAEQNLYVKSDADLEAGIASNKVQWFTAWPTGIRYDARCLDGGAWDRSTSWGMAASLEAAIALCEKGPAWRGTHVVERP